MRFIQTSDWHAGLKAAWAGDASARIAAARVESFRNVARIAAAEQAEFCLLAGDLFDSHAIGLAAAQEAVDIIEGFPCPVFVIPGNHDQDAPGSLWDRLSLGSLKRFTLLRTPAPVAIPGGTLYPCPLSRRWSSDDPMAWIPPRTPYDGIRIALAHGSLDSPQFGGDAQHPIPPDAAGRYGLDYAALGDWHSTNIQLRLAYSGTPEMTSAGDRDAGNVLVVEIGAPGEPPKITPKRSGILTSISTKRTVQSGDDLQSIIDELIKIASPSTLITLTLSGIIPIGQDDKIKQIKDLLENQFVWSKFLTPSLLPEGASVPLPAYFSAVESTLKSTDSPESRLALIHLYEGAAEAGQ